MKVGSFLCCSSNIDKTYMLVHPDDRTEIHRILLHLYNQFITESAQWILWWNESIQLSPCTMDITKPNSNEQFMKKFFGYAGLICFSIMTEKGSMWKHSRTIHASIWCNNSLRTSSKCG